MTTFYDAGFRCALNTFLKRAQDTQLLQLQAALDAIAQLTPQRGKKYKPALETPPGMPKEPPGFGFSFPATAGFSYDVGRAGLTFVDIGDASVS